MVKSVCKTTVTSVIYPCISLAPLLSDSVAYRLMISFGLWVRLMSHLTGCQLKGLFEFFPK